MLYPITSYLRFLLRSGNAHGLHSPFVYDLYTKCIRDTESYKAYQLLNDHRKALGNSKETILVTDLGAGSRIFKEGKARKVAAISRNAGAGKKEQRLLYRLARYFKPAQMLELGTSVGLGSSALALGSPTGKLVTIEGCPNTARVAQKYFDQYSIDHISLVNDRFDHYLNDLDHPLDLIYLDGHHSYEATGQLFEQLLPFTHNDTLLIIDDIYWSRDMQRAWQEIIAAQKVTVSVDLYWMGLIFFRKEQPKQHFRLRM